MEELKEFLLYRVNWDAIFPIFTLLLGFFLGYGKDYLDRRRKVNNIKKILFTELGDNQGLLLTIKRLKIEKEEDFHLVVEMSEYASSVVYKTYLDRLDTLKEREIEALSYAHFQIQTVKKFILKYSDIISHPTKYEIPEEKLVGVVTSHLADTIDTAMRHIFYAMLIMQNKKVPEDANELDITELEADIEAEIEEASG